MFLPSSTRSVIAACAARVYVRIRTNWRVLSTARAISRRTHVLIFEYALTFIVYEHSDAPYVCLKA